MIQFLRFCQKSRTSILSHNSLRRTAKIQIQFRIAIFPQCPFRRQKTVCLIRQNLRDHMHSLIMIRQNIILLFGTKLPFLIGRNKRCHIFIDIRKYCLAHISMQISGNSFHWCHIKLHISNSLSVIYFYSLYYIVLHSLWQYFHLIYAKSMFPAIQKSLFSGSQKSFALFHFLLYNMFRGTTAHKGLTCLKAYIENATLNSPKF